MTCVHWFSHKGRSWRLLLKPCRWTYLPVLEKGIKENENVHKTRDIRHKFRCSILITITVVAKLLVHIHTLSPVEAFTCWCEPTLNHSKIIIRKFNENRSIRKEQIADVHFFRRLLWLLENLGYTVLNQNVRLMLNLENQIELEPTPPCFTPSRIPLL